jgi:hypothetical protein
LWELIFSVFTGLLGLKASVPALFARYTAGYVLPFQGVGLRRARMFCLFGAKEYFTSVTFKVIVQNWVF